MSDFRFIKFADALKQLEIALNTLTGWGPGEKNLLTIIQETLKDTSDQYQCVLAQYQYGEEVYKRGEIYLDQPKKENTIYKQFDGGERSHYMDDGIKNFFNNDADNLTPLGILISDNYLEVFNDPITNSAPSIVQERKRSKRFPTIKIIGKRQRLLGTYKIADYFLQKESGEEINYRAHKYSRCWSITAGVKHIDFLLQEVGALKNIVDPILGVPKEISARRRLQSKDTDPITAYENYVNSYGKEDPNSYKILFINPIVLKANRDDHNFLSYLGKIAWMESSWYRRVTLSESLPDHHKKIAGSTEVKVATENFANHLFDFLSGESPAPSFIAIHDAMEIVEKGNNLKELKRYVPDPIATTHIVPMYYGDSNVLLNENQYTVWIYPAGKYTKAMETNIYHIVGDIKSKLEMDELDIVLFTRNGIYSPVQDGGAEEAAKAIVIDQVGVVTFKNSNRESSMTTCNTKSSPTKLNELEVAFIDGTKPNGVSEKAKRVCRHLNENSLNSFILVMIKHNNK